MVFGGQITFSTPPKIVSAPTIFLRPPVCFFGGFFVFSAPKTKIGFFGGRLRSNIFGAQAEKPRFFFFFRRRLVMVFGGQITFSPPPKYFSAAFFYFLGAPKNRRFSAPKTKNRLFRRAPKEQKVAFWVHPPYEPLAVKIVLRFSKGFRVYRGTHLEGPRRLRMKGS